MRSLVWLAATMLLAACRGEAPSTARWPDRSDPIGGTPPLGYLSNNGDDTISVVELTTMTEVARRHIGMAPIDPEAPHHLAIDPEAGFVWVGLSNVGLRMGGGLHGAHGGGLLPSYVQRLRLEDLTPDGETRVDTNLGDVLTIGDGRIVSAHFDLARALDAATRSAPPEEGWGAVVVVDGDAMTRIGRVPVCTAPHGMAVTRDGSTGVVACYGDDAIAIVDLREDPPAVSARIPVGPSPGTITSVRYGAYGVALSPDESFAYVNGLDGQVLLRVDLETQMAVTSATVLLDGSAFFGAFDAAGERFWATTQGRDTVVRIDVATATVAHRRAFTSDECRAPHEAVFHAGLDRVFVVCEGDHVGPGRLVALDPTSLEITGAVDVGVYPDAMRIVEGP